MNTELKMAADRFLEPIVAFIEASQPECIIFWLQPNSPEDGSDYVVSYAELEHQVRESICEGFLVTARGEQLGDTHLLSIVIWEEWDGTFVAPRWAPVAGERVFQKVWSGIEKR